MKKPVKKAKKVEKKEKLIKAVAPKAPKKVKKSVLDSVYPTHTIVTPSEVVNLDCPACKGIGLARPDFVASPVCEVCNGSGKQN